MIDWLWDQWIVDLLEGGDWRLRVGSSDQRIEVVRRLLTRLLLLDRLNRGIRKTRKSSV